MTRVVLAFALVLCIGADVGAADRPVKIFVGAPSRDGFVDATKDIRDSIKDVGKRLTGKDTVLVPRREDADLTITIIARGVGSQPWGQRLSYQETYRGAELASVPIAQTTWWVAAVLDVDAAGYRKEFVGTYTHPPGLAYYGGAWGDCATRLTKDLKAWIEANRARVTAPQPAPTTAR